MQKTDPCDYQDMTRVRPEVAEAMRQINELGPTFAARAKAVKNDASFPTENYRDLADHGFLRLSIPVELGGGGFSMDEYPMVGSEIAKYRGATELTFSMHNSSMARSRFMYDMPNLSDTERAEVSSFWEKHFRVSMKERAICSQPFPEGGQNWTSKPNQTQARALDGWPEDQRFQ